MQAQLAVPGMGILPCSWLLWLLPLLCSWLLQLLPMLCTHHSQRWCYSQGTLRLLAGIKPRGFCIHPPAGELQPHSEVSIIHLSG